MSVDPDGVWPEYRSVGQTGIYVYPGDGLNMPEYPGYLLRSADISIDMPAYLFGMLCRSREAGLTVLHGLLVRHIGPVYGQRLYPGYKSQPRRHFPTIKEEDILVWKRCMVTGCTVEVYQPSLCTSTALTSEW
jgi:hypothetical protein